MRFSTKTKQFEIGDKDNKITFDAKIFIGENNKIDGQKANKNFKLATLSSIALMNDITGYDDVIKSACKGLQDKELAETFIDIIDQNKSKNQEHCQNCFTIKRQ